MNKRAIAMLAGLLALVFLFSACGGGDKPTVPDPKPDATLQPDEPDEPMEPEKPKWIDQLTGLETTEEAYDTAPVAVMINNLKKALPQFGIGEAGIVYECLTEGGITRLMPVFNNYRDIPQIGPVRSARDYYIDLSYNHGAYYIHYGGSPQAYQKIKDTKVKELDGLSTLDKVMFWRDPERMKKKGMYEHSAMTSGEKILAGLEYKKFEDTLAEDPKPAFSFAEEEVTPAGTAANHVTIPYGYYITPEYTYDADKKVYLRSQFGEAHIDGNTGKQLSFKNLLIIYVSQKTVDSEGRQQITTTGTGEGLYITNGQAIEITFKKADLKTPAKYYTADGKELLVNPGKTMINLVSKTEAVGLE